MVESIFIRDISLLCGTLKREMRCLRVLWFAQKRHSFLLRPEYFFLFGFVDCVSEKQRKRSIEKSNHSRFERINPKRIAWSTCYHVATEGYNLPFLDSNWSLFRKLKQKKGICVRETELKLQDAGQSDTVSDHAVFSYKPHDMACKITSKAWHLL